MLKSSARITGVMTSDDKPPAGLRRWPNTLMYEWIHHIWDLAFLNQYRPWERNDYMSSKVSVQTTFYIHDRNPTSRACGNNLVPTSMEKMVFSLFECVVLFWVQLSTQLRDYFL